MPFPPMRFEAERMLRGPDARSKRESLCQLLEPHQNLGFTLLRLRPFGERR